MNTKSILVRHSITGLTLASLLAVAVSGCSVFHPKQSTNAEFATPFYKMCGLAVAQVTNENSKGPYFVDSYGVRALCVAYDLTGKQEYLDACKVWSERMVRLQEQMVPAGAYYMHYNRKPGETSGDWYAADSSSIGMAVLATAVRCSGEEKERFVNSAKNFAELVLNHYVQPDGSISDGLWSKSSKGWWCSSGLFGSFMFNLYACTHDERYLKAGLGVVDWLNGWDLTKDQPFPLSQQGPAMIMYVMECYSAGWPYITQDAERAKAAQAKVQWCMDWIAEQQPKPILERKWPANVGWGMKFGGLPFHQYIFSKQLPDGDKLTAAGDHELPQLATLVFSGDNGKPVFSQLPMFMMMSYAERLDPGDIYRSGP